MTATRLHIQKYLLEKSVSGKVPGIGDSQDFSREPYLGFIGATDLTLIDVAGTVSRVAKVGKDINDVVNDATNNNNNKRLESLLGSRQAENQLAWQECHDQLTSASLTFSSPANGCK